MKTLLLILLFLLFNPLESLNSKATIVFLYVTALFTDISYIQSIELDMEIVSGLLLALVPPLTPEDDRPSRRLSKEEKAKITLSSELSDILVGLILGDLTCQKQKLQWNPTFKFVQGMIHKEYLFHLYDLFQDYCSKSPKKCNTLPDKRTRKIYTYLVFYTYSLPCLVPLYEQFFVEGKKIVPANIGELLTPLGLCY